MDSVRTAHDARLFYLIGASGCGKDTLLDYCRAHLRPDDGVHIARRCITRPAMTGGEVHIALTVAEFEQRRSAGCFALHWQANGLCYGIDREIDEWLGRGWHVLVNGSRGHLEHATQRYAQRLIPVEVRVAAATLRARLLARARENPAQIQARLQRTQDRKSVV